MAPPVPAKLDLKKLHKPLYAAPAGKVVHVAAPALRYLMLDGSGDPNTAPAFAAGVEALYTAAYTLKFLCKKGPQAQDWGVMPLEGLWWTDDPAGFAAQDKDAWQWTLLILQPDLVTSDMVAQALDQARAKKKLPALDQVRLEALEEGDCAQTLHVGPFSEEGPAVERVHAFIASQGKAPYGKHHEIYLSDMRRVPPEKWKTIVRQPMR